jgi:hypothetical protein
MKPNGRKEDTYYVISYRDPKDTKVKSLNARTIEDSNLGLSFVAVSDFLFKESVIIDPSEEDLKDRFADTKRLHLSIYTILSIEEKGDAHEGLTFKHDKANLVVLPSDRNKEE